MHRRLAVLIGLRGADLALSGRVGVSMPTIIGSQADDFLTGTPLNDVIEGGWGDDVINAGDGDDILIDSNGNNVLNGGAGNDFIQVSNYANFGTIYRDIAWTNVINAGDGADVVEIDRAGLYTYTIDLGAGSDLLTVRAVYYGLTATITTGSGADRIVLDTAYGSGLRYNDTQPLVVTDFTAGAGGDILDLGGLIHILLATFPHAANPFASGHLVLVQSGADVIVRIDLDGAAGPETSGWYDREVVRLSNVTIGALTAYNFAGFAPDGSAPLRTIISGTAGSEWLHADPAGSTVNGLGGNDRLTGSAVGDVLDGGSGNDILDGGYGNDVLRGGDGDDILLDPVGNDVLDGGAGNDTIDINRPQGAGVTALTVNGGDGDDFVRIVNADGGSLNVDLGAGNDRFEVPRGLFSVYLTLGAGQDHVSFIYFNFRGLSNPDTMVITDFAAGNSGDVLHLGEVMQSALGSGWDGIANPFSGGYLSLLQSGADTIIMLDYDAGGSNQEWIQVARLLNVSASSLTAFNFNGYAPDGSVSGLNVGTTTAGNDHLIGTFASDTLNGGDGNDLIEDRLSGNDMLIGGAGDDRIILARYDSFIAGLKTVTIDAGTGNDVVDVAWYEGLVNVDLGAGNDRLILRDAPNRGTYVTLGAGADVLELALDLSSTGIDPIIVQDFTTGAGGDRLEWAGYVEQICMNGDPDYNPFYEGDARLVQVGANTELQVRTFNTHTSIPLFQTLIVFANTTPAAFTPFNIGYEPFHPTQSGGSDGDILTGTAGVDVLYGNGGDDQLNGLDGNDMLSGHDGADTLSGGNGNDQLRGGAGNDQLNGGAGSDNLDGEFGIDTVDGGDGDDLIYDWFGIDTIFGGTGNDTINISIYHDSLAPTLGSLSAGDGNDLVTIGNGWIRQGYSVDLGAGNDIVRMVHAFGPLTLGAGQDRIEWASSYNIHGPLVVTDFATGNGGDVFDLRVFLESPLGDANIFAVPGFDPFVRGHVELRQVGNDVEMWFHRQGYDAVQFAQEAVVRFLNTSLAQFTSANFGGYNPHAVANWGTIVSGDLTIAAGTTRSEVDVTPVDGNSAAFIFAVSTTNNLVNHGTISSLLTMPGMGVAVGVYGGPYAGTSSFLNASDGSVQVRAVPVGIHAYGVRAVSNFRNDGLITVQSDGGDAIGQGGGSVLNYGTITVTAARDATGAYVDGTADNRGTINVTGGQSAIGLYWVDMLGSFFNNSGTITAQVTASSPYASIGVYIGERTGIEYHHYNSGTIVADIAIYADTFIRSGSDAYQAVDILHNSGIIEGAVMLAAGNDVVQNSGTMSGATLLEDGNDRYEGATGVHLGTVEGGNGNDTLIGGAGVETFYGDIGSDNLSGGGGNDFLDGGLGNDAIDGGAGIDTVSFSESPFPVTVDLAAGSASDGQSNDTLIGIEDVIGSHGNDILLGSSVGNLIIGAGGADQLDGRGGDDVLRGERGNDVMTGGSGNDIFLFSLGDGADVVQDFAVGDTLGIHGFSGAQSISQVGSDVVLILSATDRVTLRNVQLATVQAGVTYSATQLSNVPVAQDQTIVIQSATLTLNPGNRLTIDNPAPFETGDVFRRGIGIILADSGGGAADFYNSGSYSLHVSDTSATAYGVRSDWFGNSTSGIDVVNLSTGVIDVQSDNSAIVGVYAVQNVWNLGTMNVTSLAGDAVAFGVDYGGQISNIGTLHVQAAGRALGTTTLGASYTAGHIFNSGDILIEGGGRSAGFEFVTGAHPMAPNTWLVNRGTIRVSDNTATQDSAGLLVSWGGNADIFNSGTIEGEFSIRTTYQADYGYTGMLSIYNSGSLIGDIYLVGGSGDNHFATIVNTGSIQGSVDLGGSNDVYDGRLGTVTGTIRGNEGNDQLLAGLGAQTLLGGFGNDLLSGGGGNDILTGGVGADIFRYETGFGVDTITDFAPGVDQIHVRGYSAWSSIQQVGNDVVVTFGAGATLILANQLLANISASHFTFGVAAIADRVIPTAPTPTVYPGGIAPTTNDARNDFNGDGRSDILWRNVDGQMSNWLGQANGGFVQNNANAAAVVPVAWQIAGTGDFNGDGRDDILWRNVDGQISNWLATAAGGYTQNNANAAAVVPTAWHVVGTGDFNGDGRDDILWRHNDGTVSNWLGTAAGGFTPNDANAARFAPTSWHVAGTGDFNGDGRDDVLWRNDNGQLSNWLGQANGGFQLNDAVALTMVDPAWKIAGTGDFNGDGRDDILWRHTDGTLSNWLGQANGGFVNNGGVSGTNVPLAWSVVAIGDYNGDGRDDILWRHTDGTLSNWLGTATGGFTPNDANAATPVPTSWEVQPEPFWL